MSRNPSDASPDARREEAVTRRLGEAFERLAAPVQGQCLDAEQIAAYQERALEPEEAEQCEAHFAVCSRCREVLALLAATEDAAVADRASAAAAATALAKPSRPRAWRLLWLAPALAATAAVALLMMVRAPSRSLESQKSPSLIAEAPPPEQLTAPNEALAPPIGNEATAPPRGRGRGREEAVPAAPNPQAAPPASAVGSLNTPAPANAQPSSEAAAKSEVSPTPAAPSANAAAAPPPPPPPGAPTESAANTAPPAPQAEAPAIRAMSRDAASLAAPQASAGAAAPAPRAGLFAAAQALGAFAVTLRSPSGAVSWRAGATGRIERSADGGRTWQAQASPTTEDWLAGSAVSDTVCWLVGRNGAIARTADGEHWLRIPPPPAADAVSGKLPDWSSVTAGGPGTALVGSATGKFITRDAGNAWQPQP